MANYSSGEEEGKKGRNKEEEDRLVSLPSSLHRNVMPLIFFFFFFFNYQGLFSMLPTQYDPIFPSSSSNSPPLSPLFQLFGLPLHFSAFTLLNIACDGVMVCFFVAPSFKGARCFRIIPTSSYSSCVSRGACVGKHLFCLFNEPFHQQLCS